MNIVKTITQKTRSTFLEKHGRLPDEKDGLEFYFLWFAVAEKWYNQLLQEGLDYTAELVREQIKYRKNM